MPKPGSPELGTPDPIAAAAAAAAAEVQISEEPQAIEVGPDDLQPEGSEPDDDGKETDDLIGGKWKTVEELIEFAQTADQERRASMAEFNRLNPLIKKAQTLEPFLDMAANNPAFRDHVLAFPGFDGDGGGNGSAPDLPEDLSDMRPEDLQKVIDQRVREGLQMGLEDERRARAVESRNQAQISQLRELGLDDGAINELVNDVRNNPPSLADVWRSRNLDNLVQSAIEKKTKELMGKMGGRGRAPSVGAAGGQADEVIDFVKQFKAGISKASV